jgi:hypothetical protein
MQTVTTTTRAAEAAAAAPVAATLTVQNTAIHLRLGISKVSTGTLHQGTESRNAMSL